MSSQQYIPQDLNTNFIRADFKPEFFDTAIKQKGYKVLWEQAMFCPCIDTKTGQPDYGCSSCKGSAYVYFNAMETKALVTSINGHKEQSGIGLQDLGTAYLTPVSTDNVGFRDKFTFVDFTTKYSEVLIKDNSNTNKTNYGIVKIISVRSLNSVYALNTDFTVSNDKRHIIWNTGAIPNGTQFSVLYDINPVYIAMGPVHEIRGSYTVAKGLGQELFVQLPKQFMIKREDFLSSE